MALNRIQLAGTSDGTGAYTFSINPVSLDWPGEAYQRDIKMIDSEQATQNIYWDDRQVVMTWRNLPLSNTAFASQVAVLRGYIGTKKYINLRDLAGLVPSESASWIGPFRVKNVIPKIREGGGKFWESVELILIRTT